ncbi:hypothetical protein ACTXT7_001122 [Hymenolepis weldensis]
MSQATSTVHIPLVTQGVQNIKATDILQTIEISSKETISPSNKHDILKIITLDTHTSPFLSTPYYSLVAEVQVY